MLQVSNIQDLKTAIYKNGEMVITIEDGNIVIMKMEEYINKANEIISEVKKIVIGKDDIIKKVLTTILAKGNILIEDIPGVGKTTLALSFSKAMSLDCKRLQFTPDVLPSDVLGFSIYNKEAFDSNCCLSDEIMALKWIKENIASFCTKLKTKNKLDNTNIPDNKGNNIINDNKSPQKSHHKQINLNVLGSPIMFELLYHKVFE